ncbi:MAG: hypothetical protein L6R39_006395, partial [Caloplaca ligustica]
MKKRKRRSTTPPPSSESVQKKAKIEDVRSRVKLPEDTSMEDVDATTTTDASAVDPPHAQKPSGPEDITEADAPAAEVVEANGQPDVPAVPAETQPSTGQAAEGAVKASDEPEKSPEPQTPKPKADEPSSVPTEPPVKPSPSDT